MNRYTIAIDRFVITIDKEKRKKKVDVNKFLRLYDTRNELMEMHGNARDDSSITHFAIR